jgi:hypothetical protein
LGRRKGASKKIPPELLDKALALIRPASELVCDLTNQLHDIAIAIPLPSAVDHATSPAVAQAEANGKTGNAKVELIVGGFSYCGKPNDLSGRPLAMLQELLKSKRHRCSARELRVALNINDEDVEYPEQVIRDTAKTLRQALKEAVIKAGRKCANPLPHIGRGPDLTYKVEMP